MSADLFTDEPPTELGWYWVRMYGYLSVKRYADGFIHVGDGTTKIKNIQYGPRIPTPEQCAAMAKE